MIGLEDAMQVLSGCFHDATENQIIDISSSSR
jgi:hypothetical protein